MSRPRNALKMAKHKFNYNRKRCIRLGRVWELSFDEWYKWWLALGIDKNIPSGLMNKDTICLMRKDESKPYKLSNIIPMTHGHTDGVRACYRKPIRPETWKIKDPIEHPKYIPFLRAKAQSDYRVRQGLEEGGWDLTFEEFSQLWGDLWVLRGRASSDYCMTREDLTGPWDIKNTIIITRKESLQHSRAYSESTGTRWGRKKI